VSHIVHFGSSGEQNDVALFSMLRWAQCGFHKICAGTRYAEHVFVQLVRSVGHVVHSVASGPRNIEALFFMLA
jgi:hypothetical protein